MLTPEIEEFIREEIKKGIIESEQAENNTVNSSLNKLDIPYVHEFADPYKLARAVYKLDFIKSFPELEKLPKNIMFRVLLNIIKNCIFYTNTLKEDISILSIKLISREARDEELLMLIRKLESKNNEYDLKIQKLQNQIEMLEIKTMSENCGDF